MSYRFTSSVFCLCPLVAAFACGGDRFDEECPTGSTKVGTACVKDNPGAGAAGSAGGGAGGAKAGGAGVGGGAAGLGGAGGAGTAGTSGVGGAGAAGSSGAAGKGGSAGGGSGAAGAAGGSGKGGGAGQGGGGSSAGSAGTSGGAGKAGGAGAGGAGAGGTAGGAGGGAGAAGTAGQTGGAAGASGSAGAGGDGGTAGASGMAGEAGAAGAGGDPGCQDGKTKCEGVTLQTCEASAWKDVRTCTLGCESEKCVSVVSLAVGGSHACAALSNGTVRCWGESPTDALGAPGVTLADTPVQVQGVANVTSVAVGTGHSCARTSLGEVWCWGSNGVTQLGVTTPGLTQSATPVKVTGVSGAASLSAMHNKTCAVLSGGKISCWGAFPSPTPSVIAGPTDTVQVTVGGKHLCARDSAGVVFCWGDNQYGQSGGKPIGGTVDSPNYVASGATNVQAGDSFSCFLRASPNNQVFCWGSDNSGALGNGPSLVDPTATPGLVSGLATAELMAAGSASVLAVEGDATKCWGDQADFECANAPQNGNDVVEFASVIPDWTAKPVILAPGRGGGILPGMMSCAVFGEEQVRCWTSWGAHANTVWTVPW